MNGQAVLPRYQRQTMTQSAPLAPEKPATATPEEKPYDPLYPLDGWIGWER